MKTQREKAIINYFSPHKAMDVVDFYSWLDPSVTLVVPEELPWGGVYIGFEGVGTFITNVTRRILSEINLEEVFTPSRDRVVAIGWSNGKTVDGGQPFHVRVTQLFTFNEYNKISRVEFLTDLNAYAGLLGVKPSPP